MEVVEEAEELGEQLDDSLLQMDELNIDYRLDPTHFTEYKHGDLEQECEKAGYCLLDKHVQWGELYCVLTPEFHEQSSY